MTAWVTGLPLLIIFITGALLQFKNWIPAIQPPSQKGSSQVPQLEWAQILSQSRSVSAANVQDWKDIRSIDIRPAQGTARVRTQNHLEITLDLGTGRVLQAAPRKTHLLIELHEGSFFGKTIRYGLFLPTSLVIILLWISGVALLIRPWRLKRVRSER